MKNYRHGDVDIKQVEEKEVPKNLKKLETLTLAYGEATGHHHTFIAEHPGAVQVYEDDKGNKWMNLTIESKLTHQEHKTITITPGWYVVKTEQEFDPFKEAIQAVRD